MGRGNTRKSKWINMNLSRGGSMAGIGMIQAFVQEYTETIAQVLEVDITIVDENNIRIGGTGPYKPKLGQLVPHGSLFRRILLTGEPGIIQEHDRAPACRECTTAGECLELATMGFPILQGGRPIGVIGIMAFTAEQKERIIAAKEKLWSFLTHMSSLLESKLMLVEANQRLQQQVDEAREAAGKSCSFGSMLGRSRAFKELVEQARRIAPGISTVLIRGESGTGKELLAQAIYAAGSRADRPFVVVNCPSIPESLLESELFGYEGGAFTGANKDGKPGKFELAQRGTLFLDEIGDLPLSLQPKLLRVVQERVVDRVGGCKPIPVDVRVIAATNRDLESMVGSGAFRADLYYRLNVIPLHLPPLRDRPEDVELYLWHFLSKYSERLHRPIRWVDPHLLEWLRQYRWPGNVRELENVAEYMVNMAQSELIGFDEMPHNLVEHGGRSDALGESERWGEESGPEKPGQETDVGSKKEAHSSEKNLGREEGFGLEERVAAFERELLVHYVSKGASLADKRQAAQKLKISLATLYRKLERYGLS